MRVCSKSYTWKHNEVLEIFAETAKICCETVNKALNDITNRAIHFVKEGNILKLSCKNKYRSSLLDGNTDWHVTTDLDHFVFPTEIALTTLRPYIIIWSGKLKKVFVIELTVPFEKKSTGHIRLSWKNIGVCENNMSEMAG